MVDINSLIHKDKKQEETPPKTRFSFAKSNSLADNSAGNAASPVEKGKTAKFNFSKEPPKPSFVEKSEAVSTDEKSNSTVPIPAEETLPSVDDLKNMNVDNFVDRNQPEKYSGDSVQKLEEAMALLKEHIDDKQIVGQAITIVMRTLQQNPELKNILRTHPENLQMMVRGLRTSYGTVIQKKSANKSKRAASAKRVDETVALLSDLGFTQNSDMLT